MGIKACLIDLHGTIARVDDPVDELTISDFLVQHGYHIYPQQIRAAWSFVAFIDYPRYGYKSWYSYLRRIFQRLGVKVDRDTIKGLIKLLDRTFVIYPDVYDFLKVIKKDLSLKTAIVTTIAKFKFYKYLKPILPYIDLLMTGYEARCEKSNPKIFIETLNRLNVKPNEAIMIGDSVLVDIIVPKRVGIRTIFLDRSGDQEKPELADAKVNNLIEAIDVIKKFL
ncbi:MAG: HAD family hydrolase [Candidatus Asgardarchaeum sp.]